MLKEILQRESCNMPIKAMNLISGKPTIKEMARELSGMIFGCRYDSYHSFEFVYEKEPYGFACDVTVYDHASRFVLTDVFCSKDGIQYHEPGIDYDLEIETKQLLEAYNL